MSRSLGWWRENKLQALWKFHCVGWRHLRVSMRALLDLGL